MAKENKILAIDIGGENLKMAEFQYSESGSISLTAFAFRKMVALEGESNGEKFRRYYNEMLMDNNFTATDVRISLPAQNSFQRLSKLPPTLGNRAAVDKLIEYEASQTVPYPIDEIEWGYQLLYHEWEEMVPEEQEDGTIQEVPVKREDNEALFIAMKSEDVVCYTDVIEESGRQVLSVDVAPVALFNAALAAQIKENECALLISIGGSSTSLMIADNRRVFMRNIPTAGDAVTAQIAREFSIGPDHAEDFKRRYGFVALGGAYEEPESELAAKISKLTRNVMTRLHGEISRSVSVWRAQHGGSTPTRVLLAGGGSTMLYTTEFFNEKLRIPAEYLNTFTLIGIGSQVDKALLQSTAPMSQELIGLAIRHLGHCPLDISLLPKAIKKQIELNTRKVYLYASAATLIVSLLIWVFGLFLMLDFEKRRVSEIKTDLDKAEMETKRIQQLKSELDGFTGQYDEVDTFLKDRGKWAKMVNEIQKKMPPNMWLVTLEYDSDRKLKSTGNENSESYSEEQVATSNNDPNKRQTVDEVSNNQDINRVRLVGYTRNEGADRGAAVYTFIRNLSRQEDAESSFFDVGNVRRRDSVDTNDYNLSYFEIILMLKEPLRK